MRYVFVILVTVFLSESYAQKNCMDIPQMRQFDFWVGTWDVFATGTEKLVGKNIIEIASGGCMLLENWTALGPQGGSGKSMNYVNPETKKWEQLWIGSGGPPQKFVDGEYRDNAMRFTFTQVDQQGRKQIGRFIFYNEGPNQVRQFNEVSSDDGKTWTTVYDLTYKRKDG